jgi:hypothetical protein
VPPESTRLDRPHGRIAGKNRGPLDQYTPPQEQQWQAAGWNGMYDSRGNVQDPTEAALLINLIPSDILRPGPVYIRSGRIPLGNLATAPQLTAGIQWIGDVTLTAGGTRTIAISGGEIYEVNLGTGVLTKRISTANLTTATITAPSGAVFATVFNGTLAVAGFNQGVAPFTWDGTAGGGLVKLTNAPTSVWGMTVYFAKLFFIKGLGSTIVWSEENQANTGYEAGSYVNAWTLAQTSNEPLTAILGTNEGLYYGRETSVGIIRGAVTSTFSTEGVHDSVHVGSGPSTWVHFGYADGVLYWADYQSNVYARPAGGEVRTITDQLPRMMGYDSTYETASNYRSKPVYGVGEENLTPAHVRLLTADPVNRRLYVDMGKAGTLGSRWMQVYDLLTLKLLCLWTYGTANSSGPGTVFGDRTRFATMGRFSLLANNYVFVDENGYIFQQEVASINAVSATADKTEAGVATPIVATFLGPKHGDNHQTEYRFTKIDVVYDQIDGTVSIGTGYITSRSHKVSLAPAKQTVGTGSSNNPFEKRLAVGLGPDASGRWLRPIFTLTGSVSQSAGSQPSQLFGYTLTGVPVSESPSAI